MSVLWAVGIFFSPSSAVRALFFSSYLKERGTSFSPSSVRHVEKIEHFQARKRTNFFFSTRKRHARHDLLLSLFTLSSLKIALSQNRSSTRWSGGWPPNAKIFRVVRATTIIIVEIDNDERESKRERGKEERKKNIRKRRERRRGSKNSWVRHIFFSFMKFFEALKRKRTSRITQQPGRARVR